MTNNRGGGGVGKGEWVCGLLMEKLKKDKEIKSNRQTHTFFNFFTMTHTTSRHMLWKPEAHINIE